MPGERSHPIQSLSVRNFACLKDLHVDFEPFTVLVGPNDVGKSMILRAIETVGRVPNEKEGWRTVFPAESDFTATAFGNSGGPIAFSLEGVASGSAYQYAVELNVPYDSFQVTKESLYADEVEAVSKYDEKSVLQFPDESSVVASGDRSRSLLAVSSWSGGTAAVAEARRWLGGFRDLFAGFHRYHLLPERIETSVPISRPPEKRALARDGFGLPKAFADLLHQRRDLALRIEESLKNAIPRIERVDLRQVPSASEDRKEAYELEIVLATGARIPASLISDGVLLYLTYLVIAMGEPQASVLLIEEPETGIHPGLLSRLVGLLREISEGKHGGHPVQVIVTTHSPLLVNYMEPHEIRVVQRDKEGATRISPFDKAPDLSRLLDYQGPGQIWVNLGEEYLTGSGTHA